MAEAVALLSYSREDDKNANGYISRLAEELRKAVRLATPVDFHIVKDTEIRWGKVYQDALIGTIDTGCFLLAVMTPRFFESQDCRKEVARMLKREKTLGRKDLVLTIHFMDCGFPKDLESCTDEIMADLGGRQWSDWRSLRLKGLGMPAQKNELTRMAKTVKAILERPSPKSLPGKDIGSSAGFDQKPVGVARREGDHRAPTETSDGIGPTWLGQPHVVDGVAMTVMSVRHHTTPHITEARVGFTVDNDGPYPIRRVGHFRFELNDRMYEREFNNQGYTITGGTSTGWVYPGEEVRLEYLLRGRAGVRIVGLSGAVTLDVDGTDRVVDMGRWELYSEPEEPGSE